MPPPLELTDAVAETICSAVERGRPIPLAAEMAGFTGRAVFKWQAQGKADLESGDPARVGSVQARFVQRLARARGGVFDRLHGLVLAGISSPREVDAKAALSAMKTFLPAYVGDRSLEVQAALESASAQPEPAEASAQPGAVTVETVRCPGCGTGTATDDPAGRVAFCGNCGQRLEAK